MESASIVTELANLVGDANVIDRETLEPHLLLPAGWNEPPIAMVRATETAQLADIVCAAEAAGVAILPYGGGTQWETGNSPTPGRPYIMLRTSGLNRILDYQPEDMTVTCEPGVTLSDLQNALIDRGQFLPLDVPLASEATVGGIVATNRAGFWRASYGSPRDLVIGVRAVMTAGKAVRGGGKVVKNVAGYDLCKLFTGSWGSLGILSEVTFKVRSRPESQCVLAWSTRDIPSAARLGLALHHSRLGATYVLVTNEMDDGQNLLVGLHGTAERMEWQAREFTKRVGDSAIGLEPRALGQSEFDALRDRQARLGREFEAAVTIVCLPTEVDALVRSLGAQIRVDVTADCATGIVNIGLRAADAATLGAIVAARPAGSTVTWTRIGRNQDTSTAPIWGEIRDDFKLMRALKTALDPKGTFNPGRFVGSM